MLADTITTFLRQAGVASTETAEAKVEGDTTLASFLGILQLLRSLA